MKGDEERTRRAVELQPQKSELDGQSTVHFVWVPPSLVGGGCAERRCKRRGDEVDNSKAEDQGCESDSSEEEERGVLALCQLGRGAPLRKLF